jgi:glucosylceramidase
MLRRRLLRSIAASALLGPGLARAFSHGTANPPPPGPPTIQPTGIDTANSQVNPLAALSLPAMNAMSPGSTTVTVDSSTQAQTWGGVGVCIDSDNAYTLTNYMSGTQQTALLTDMFVTKGFNFVRFSFGWRVNPNNGSNWTWFSYDDTPNDWTLASFTVGQDATILGTVLSNILAVNSSVLLMGTPWVVPASIKTDPSSGANCNTGANIPNGGWFTQNSQNCTFYAALIVKSLQYWESVFGRQIDFVSLKNEPNTATPNQCLVNTAGIGSDGAFHSITDYTTLLGTYVGPAFATAGITSKLACGDEVSFDVGNSSFASKALSNSTCKPYIGAMSWHGYGSAPSTVAPTIASNPTLPAIMPEGPNMLTTQGLSTIQANQAQMIINCARVGFTHLAQWNGVLADNFPGYSGFVPTISVNHTTGVATYQPAGLALAHIGLYVPPGARVSSSTNYGSGNVQSVSWLLSNGNRVLYLYNANAAAQTFPVYDQQLQQGFSLTMNAGDMMTITWPSS